MLRDFIYKRGTRKIRVTAGVFHHNKLSKKMGHINFIENNISIRKRQSYMIIS